MGYLATYDDVPHEVADNAFSFSVRSGEVVFSCSPRRGLLRKLNTPRYFRGEFL